MRSGSPTRALAAAALAAILVAGCERPPDEAWLRFVGFKSSDKVVTVVNVKLLDEATDSVDATFENATQTVGKSDARGTGIFVNRARVEYRLQGYTPPVYEYPVTLYLAAPEKAGEVTTGTISGLPLVPVSLKTWILNSGVQRHPEVHLTARVRFFAKTDDNNPLEIEGNVLIVLENSGGTAKTTVLITATDPSAKESPVDKGVFTVTRDGSTEAALSVSYSVGGTATNGDDYETLDDVVVIAAGSTSATITVTPIADGDAEDPEKVIVSLVSGTGYSPGTARSATVTISD